MSGILWLASYPKSGNTWLRVFLANLLAGGRGPVDINDLRIGSAAGDRALFDDLLGVESSDLAPEEVARLRPAAYEHLAALARGLEIYKIHDALTSTPGGRPLVPAPAIEGVIYLLRNPLDVAVSHAAYFRTRPDTAIGWLADENHGLSAGHGRLEHQVPQRLLTWSGHVLSWVDAPGLRLHVMRYEDMSREPEATFRAAVRFAGLAAEPRQIRRALEWSRFDELRRQEAERGFREKLPRAESFFRRGRVGAWRETLSAGEAARVIRDHREVMSRFGYLDGDGEPVF